MSISPINLSKSEPEEPEDKKSFDSSSIAQTVALIAVFLLVVVTIIAGVFYLSSPHEFKRDSRFEVYNIEDLLNADPRINDSYVTTSSLSGSKNSGTVVSINVVIDYDSASQQSEVMEQVVRDSVNAIVLPADSYYLKLKFWVSNAETVEKAVTTEAKFDFPQERASQLVSELDAGS